MKVQLNTDKNIVGDERLEGYLNDVIQDELSNFSDSITRIEIYLADENAQKNGENDKRCTMEARIENKQPIAVTSHANTLEAAVNEALEKLKASLDSILGRLKNR